MLTKAPADTLAGRQAGRWDGLGRGGGHVAGREAGSVSAEARGSPRFKVPGLRQEEPLHQPLSSTRNRRGDETCVSRSEVRRARGGGPWAGVCFLCSREEQHFVRAIGPLHRPPETTRPSSERASHGSRACAKECLSACPLP